MTDEMRGQGCDSPEKGSECHQDLSPSLICSAYVCLLPLSLPTTLLYFIFAIGEDNPLLTAEFILPLFKRLASLRLHPPTSSPMLVPEEGAGPSLVRHPPQVQSSVVWRRRVL